MEGKSKDKERTILYFILPPPSITLDGRSLTCDICETVLARYVTRGVSRTVADNIRKHIIEDLQPYICKFVDCLSPMKTYGSLRAFINHVIAEEYNDPQSTWCCDLKGCGRRFLDKGSMLLHVEGSRHYGRVGPLPFIEDTKIRAPDTTCPFCQEKMDRRRNMLSLHLAQHMLEISYAGVASSYTEWKFFDDSSSGKSSQH